MSLGEVRNWVFDMDGTLTVAVHDFAAIRVALDIPAEHDILTHLAALPADLAAAKHWQGNYDKEPDRAENSWHFLEAGGRKFLVLCLEFGPREDVVRWANAVVAAHPEREVRKSAISSQTGVWMRASIRSKR